EDEDPHERHDRQEDPDEQDKPIRALQVGSPGRMCDRWHHSSSGAKPRDYTKGLGPLGRKCRIASRMQGTLQGAAGDVYRTRIMKAAAASAAAALTTRSTESDRVTNLVEHRADLSTKEDQSNDRDHGDERQDQCVLR